VEAPSRTMHTHQTTVEHPPGSRPATTTYIDEIPPGAPTPGVVGETHVDLPNAEAAVTEQARLTQAGPQGEYDIVNNSCTTHCAQVLRAGGAEVPATGLAFARWQMARETPPTGGSSGGGTPGAP
jgi:hypothetical protein